MLILFNVITMSQFLTSWSDGEKLIVAFRGGFLVFALCSYVFSRLMKRGEYYDKLVVVTFASLVFYRVFGESLVRVFYDPKREAVHEGSYWILIAWFLCTGIPFRVFAVVPIVAFGGMLLQLSIVPQWDIWVVDIPLYFAYCTVGCLLNYMFYCISYEICCLRRKPLRALADLPKQFFDELEPEALKSVPTSVLNKRLRREEHLYILLRITQMEGSVREWAIAFIEEDLEKEKATPYASKLIFRVIRKVLLTSLLEGSKNPTLRDSADMFKEDLPQMWPGSVQKADKEKQKGRRNLGSFKPGMSARERTEQAVAAKYGELKKLLKGTRAAPQLEECDPYDALTGQAEQIVRNRTDKDGTQRTDDHEYSTGYQVTYRGSHHSAKNAHGVSNQESESKRSLESPLKDYTDIPTRVINPVWDRISVRLDQGLRGIRVTWIEQSTPLFKVISNWIEGVEAIMTNAQWTQKVIHIPSRTFSGSFLDEKIERWFMAWCSTIKVRGTHTLY